MRILPGTEVAVDGYLRTRRFLDAQGKARTVLELVGCTFSTGKEVQEHEARAAQPLSPNPVNRPARAADPQVI